MTHAISSFFSHLYRDFESQPPSLKVTIIAVPAILGVGCIICYMTVPCCSLLARRWIHRPKAETCDEEALLIEQKDWIQQATELLDPTVNPTDSLAKAYPQKLLIGIFHKQYWALEYKALRPILYKNVLWTSPEALLQAQRCMLIAYAMCKLVLESDTPLKGEEILHDYLEHYQRAREGLFTSLNEQKAEELADNPDFNPGRFYQRGTEEFQWRLWRNEIALLTRSHITATSHPKLWAFTHPDNDPTSFVADPESLTIN